MNGLALIFFDKGCKSWCHYMTNASIQIVLCRKVVLLLRKKRFKFSFSFWRKVINIVMVHLPSSGPQTRGMISKMAEHDASSKHNWRASKQFSIAIAVFIFGPANKTLDQSIHLNIHAVCKSHKIYCVQINPTTETN